MLPFAIIRFMADSEFKILVMNYETRLIDPDTATNFDRHYFSL